MAKISRTSLRYSNMATALQGICHTQHHQHEVRTFVQQNLPL